MSALPLLRSMFRYQSWADGELLEMMAPLTDDRLVDSCRIAFRLLNHNCTVSQIFKAHLLGVSHNLLTDNPEEILSLSQLQEHTTSLNTWYLDYLDTLNPEKLSESTAFRFTDGDRGFMSREEMLTHVVIHNGYHRAEVGRILGQLSLPVPWDTYAVFLHRTQPQRRDQSKTF